MLKDDHMIFYQQANISENNEVECTQLFCIDYKLISRVYKSSSSIKLLSKE